MFGFGLVVELVHSGGVVTRFAHCRSALVKPGDRVQAGQAIATVGSSGLATAPHLHFEVLVRGRAVDPVRFLAQTRSIPDSIRGVQPIAKVPVTE
jgi:murein DD-endopeptidase MepM/ murein hydrolase activator NlpD